MKRLYYLDNLRIFLSILVVLHHVAVGYGTMGGWCYITREPIDGNAQIFYSAIFGVEALFSMSLFFFISAFLTVNSLERKGARLFIQSQLVRLLVPLLFVMVIFAPGILFFIEKYNATTTDSFLEYVLRMNLRSPNTSHTWFILVLICFELLYVGYWKYVRPRFSVSEMIPDKLPTHLQIAAGILICSMLTIFIRQYYPIGKSFIGLQFANFAPYIFMYALGILVARKGWLDAFSEKISRSWFWVSLLLALVFMWIVYTVMKDPSSMNKYINGVNPESILLAFIESIVCLGICGFMIYFFKNYFNFSNGLLRKMHENRYGVYIFHSGIVVALTIALEFIPLEPISRFYLASIGSVVLSFLFVAAVRLIPAVRRFI